MDEHTLTREFHRAVRDEPTLGFDPDDVVTTAGRLQRRRRATMLAATGVAAIAVAAVAVPLAIGDTSIDHAPVPAAALATTPQRPAANARKAAPGQWPPITLHFPTLSNARLTSDLAIGRQHLAAVLPSVVPGATSLVFGPPHKPGGVDGFVGRFYSVPVTTKDPNTGMDTIRDTVTRQGYSTPEVTFHAGGKTLHVGVSVELPMGTIQPGPVSTECLATSSCVVHDEPDGSVQLVEHGVEVLDVTVFRADGTVVKAAAVVESGAPANDVLPTEDQLVQLASEPAFTLTP
jgi:hypothetical protein